MPNTSSPNCSACGHLPTLSAKFCPECGNSLVSQKRPAVAREELQRVINPSHYNEHIEHQHNYGKGGGPPAARLITDYLDWLRQTHSVLRTNDIIKGVVSSDADPLELERVFVDLHTTLRIPEGESLDEYLRRSREIGDPSMSKNSRRGLLSFFRPAQTSDAEAATREDQQETAARPVGVFEPVAIHDRLVLIGDPGSGKSTVGQFVTLALATARSGDASLLDRLGVAWTHGTLLPVPLVLREFSAWLGGGTEPGRARDLWTFLRHNLECCGKDPNWVDAITETAKDGAYFILDGWDETHDPLRLARVAESMVELVANSSRTSRFLLTSRPYAWDAVLQAAAGQADTALEERDPALARRLLKSLGALQRYFPARYDVAPLEDPQITDFIRRWYEAVQCGKRPWFTRRVADEKKADLEMAAARKDLLPVVSNPLLLTLTAALSGTHLPDDRADLFNEIVDLLLKRWTEASGSGQSLREAVGRDLKLDDIREKIEECTLVAHRGHVGRDGLADISEANLQAGFASLLGGRDDLAKKVIEFVQHRAGLLIGKGLKDGTRQFSCPHRNFQEFLAGCCLAGKSSFTDTDLAADPALAPSAVILAREHPGHWREVLAFAARRAKYERGSLAAHTLVHGQSFAEWVRQHTASDTDWRCAVLAALQLLEIGLDAVRSTEVSRVRLAHVAGWLSALIEKGGLDLLRERVEAAYLLAKLGDPRPGVAPEWPPTPERPFFAWGDLIPADTAEEIKAGRAFMMGGDPKAYNGKTKFPCPIRHPFRLAKYPVTNAQYALFVRSEFFEQRKLSPPPERDLHFLGSNQPVTNVSWHEAMAFCEWLNEELDEKRITLADLGISPDDPAYREEWRIALPADVQWERAARHTDGRFLPWTKGDTKTKKGKTQPDEPLEGYCNWDGAEIVATSAVGLFPSGAAPCGCLDMIGNLREWSRSEYTITEEPLPYEAQFEAKPGSKKPRVLRGGWWDSAVPGSLRAACRTHGYPGLHGDRTGFRCVLVVRVTAAG